MLKQLEKLDNAVACTSYFVLVCIYAGVVTITVFKKYRNRGEKNVLEQNKRDHDAILHELIQRRRRMLKSDHSLHQEDDASPHQNTALSTLGTFSTDENSASLVVPNASSPEDAIQLLDDGSIPDNDLESWIEDPDTSVCSSLTCSIQNTPPSAWKIMFRRFSSRFSSLWRKSYSYEDVINHANLSSANDYSSLVNTAYRASVQIDKLVADVALMHPKPRVCAGQRNVFLNQDSLTPPFELKQTPTGPVVTNIPKDSSAYHDLSIGDVILAINDIDLLTMSKAAIFRLLESKEIKITVVSMSPSETFFLPAAMTPLADEMDDRNFVLGDTSLFSASMSVDEVEDRDNEALNTSLFPSISSISMEDGFDPESDDSFAFLGTN